MKILFLNHDGGGFADHIEIEQGTTVEALFAAQMKGADTRDFLIRVNRQPVAAGQILQEGDRVSLTPRKIEGAASA